MTAGERQPLTAKEHAQRILGALDSALAIPVNESAAAEASVAALLARAVTAEAALLRRTLLLTYDHEGVRIWIADAEAKGQTLAEQLERAEMIAQLPPFFDREGSSPAAEDAKGDAWWDALRQTQLQRWADDSPAAEAEIVSGLTEGVAGENSPKASPPCAPSVSPASGVSDTREGAPCLSCENGAEYSECDDSKRECGHHCNHAWTHDRCDWCGTEFGEVTVTASASPVPAVADDPEPETCHCGQPAIRVRQPDQWEGRMDGYCDPCSWNRCDCYPDECPVKYGPGSRDTKEPTT